MNRFTTWIGVLLLVSLMLGGCSSMQPLSNYARSGDTVAVSLGGTHSNALVSVLKKGNVTVTITDVSNAQYPVKLRNLFRLYSDPTSAYDYRNVSGNNSYIDTYNQPHQGLWMAVLDLVDPTTDIPLPLAVGDATLSISSPDILNWYDPTTWGWTWTNGNLDSIPLEILEGTGAPNPLNYLAPLSAAPLDSLEPSSQIEISVQGTPNQKIGGATFVISYSNDVFPIALPPRVAAVTPDPNVQIGWGSKDQGDGTTLLTVTVINPHGFNENNNKAGLYYSFGGGGSSLLRSLSFSVFWNGAAVDDSNWQNHIQLLDSMYVDLNGDPMFELSTSVQKVN